MIDVEALRTRYRRLAGFLDERGRRLYAANEALALGRGGVTAVSAASGIARSTINRGVAELKAGSNELGERIRRHGGGRRRAVERQPGLLAGLEGLIEGAVRGDPQSPLRWVSRSQRHIATALRRQGFEASQKLVGLLLRELDYSCQANRKTREGTQHPDRNAQFEYINAKVKAALAAAKTSIEAVITRQVLSTFRWVHQRMAPGMRVSFRQLRTSRRIRPWQLCARETSQRPDFELATPGDADEAVTPR